MAVCRKYRIRQPSALLEPATTAAAGWLSDERLLVRLAILQLAMSWGLEWLREELSRDLLRSSARYRKGIEYHLYLNSCLEYFDFSVRFPRLMDEEGQHPRQTASVVAGVAGRHRAAYVRLGDPQRAARLIADLIKKYITACTGEGVAYPDCRLLLSPDPYRPAPAEPIRAARRQLRHVLLALLVDWGLERIHTDLKDQVHALDQGAARTPPCSEYLVAALAYFNFVVQYGLLRDEPFEFESARRRPFGRGRPEGLALVKAAAKAV